MTYTSFLNKIYIYILSNQVYQLRSCWAYISHTSLEARTFHGKVKHGILKSYGTIIYLNVWSVDLFITPRFFLPKILRWGIAGHHPGNHWVSSSPAPLPPGSAVPPRGPGSAPARSPTGVSVSGDSASPQEPLPQGVQEATDQHSSPALSLSLPHSLLK